MGNSASNPKRSKETKVSTSQSFNNSNRVTKTAIDQSTVGNANRTSVPIRRLRGRNIRSSPSLNTSPVLQLDTEQRKPPQQRRITSSSNLEAIDNELIPEPRLDDTLESYTLRLMGASGLPTTRSLANEIDSDKGDLAAEPRLDDTLESYSSRLLGASGLPTTRSSLANEIESDKGDLAIATEPRLDDTLESYSSRLLGASGLPTTRSSLANEIESDKGDLAVATEPRLDDTLESYLLRLQQSPGTSTPRPPVASTTDHITSPSVIPEPDFNDIWGSFMQRLLWQRRVRSDGSMITTEDINVNEFTPRAETRLSPLQGSISIVNDSTPVGPTFRCGICMEISSNEEIAVVDECKHEFCRDCMRRHISNQLGQQRYPVKCPTCMAISQGEPTNISEMLAEQVGISEAEATIWRELQLSGFSIWLHCRRCQRSANVDKQEYDQLTSLLTCPFPGCRHVWCKMCSVTIIEGQTPHSCDGTGELEQLIASSGWKRCPGCRAPIQKSSGCNHMTCGAPGCNTHFCYVCGDSIIQSSSSSAIKAGVSEHFQRCQLFEIPDE